MKFFGSQGSNKSMFPSIKSIHGWDFHDKSKPNFTVNGDWLEHSTKPIILQNTGYSITCDLEINQNIHLKRLMKYDSSNLKFVSFSSHELYKNMFGMKC